MGEAERTGVDLIKIALNERDILFSYDSLVIDVTLRLTEGTPLVSNPIFRPKGFHFGSFLANQSPSGTDISYSQHVNPEIRKVTNGCVQLFKSKIQALFKYFQGTLTEHF